MTRNTLTATVLGFALTVFSVGCDQKGSETNTNTKPATPAATNNHNSNNVNNSNQGTRSTWDPNLKREDFDKNKSDYEKRAKESGSTIGQGANDLWIWTKVRAALATTDDLRDSTINVDVENDVVTLKGNVRDAAQRTKAVTVAKGIEGVKNVKDSLTLAAAGGPGGGNTNTPAKTDKKS